MGGLLRLCQMAVLGALVACGEPAEEPAAAEPGRLTVEQLQPQAEAGVASAQYALARFYADSDPQTARIWLRRAAEQGYGPAQHELGEAELAAHNDAEALRWLRAAAEQGYGPAQVTLGLLYASGRAVAQDFAEAFAWLSLAATPAAATYRAQLAAVLSEAERARALELVERYRQAPAGTAPDLHRLWEDRCADCHGHAGDFARAHLQVVAGRLQGRHPERDLRVFLHNHYPPDGDIDALYAMLLAQTGNAARFKTQCSGCHGSAAEFVRTALERRDGVLFGRGSGQPLAEFLKGHRRLSAEEAAFFSELLERVAREVERL